MFGGLRLLLAFFVVFSHLVGTHYLQHFGFYAVRGFYVLSGFLMTAGLNDLYAFDARRYFTNRLLRLMPLYFVVCLLTLIAVVCLPAEAATFIGQWNPELLWRDAITNVLVLPLHHPEPHYRLIPTAWSLAVEIEMYVVLFLFVSRSEQHAMLALFFGPALSRHLRLISPAIRLPLFRSALCAALIFPRGTDLLLSETRPVARGDAGHGGCGPCHMGGRCARAPNIVHRKFGLLYRHDPVRRRRYRTSQRQRRSAATVHGSRPRRDRLSGFSRAMADRLCHYTCVPARHLERVDVGACQYPGYAGGLRRTRRIQSEDYRAPARSHTPHAGRSHSGGGRAAVPS